MRHTTELKNSIDSLIELYGAEAIRSYIDEASRKKPGRKKEYDATHYYLAIESQRGNRSVNSWCEFLARRISAANPRTDSKTLRRRYYHGRGLVADHANLLEFLIKTDIYWIQSVGHRDLAHHLKHVGLALSVYFFDWPKIPNREESDRLLQSAWFIEAGWTFDANDLKGRFGGIVTRVAWLRACLEASHRPRSTTLLEAKLER